MNGSKENYFIGLLHTVVDGFVLLGPALVTVHEVFQAVTDLGHDALACLFKLGQIVGLLHEGI